MEALFLKLVNMSITASWLVLAIIVVRLIFKKAPKWILCLLWGLVAVRLICPFSIESAMSLIPSAEPLPQEIIYTAEPQIHSGVTVIDNAVNPVLESSMTPAELTSANPTQIWSFILSQVWILGMVLMFAYTLVSYLLLKRKVATAIPLVKGIKQSEYVDSPFVLGIIRPVIYLPFSMEEGDMAYVIAHEKAHIRRRDHWWKPFGFLLLSIYWFNPVLWMAYILLCRDIETACDEKVIKDMKLDDRRAYSTALLNCSIHRRSIAACPLAFGEMGVKARVKSVMNYKKPAFWVILIALIVSVVVAVCFMTNPEKDEEINSGYELIQSVSTQNGYSILNQESIKVNLVIEKDKLPEECFTLKGHTFEVKEVIPYQTNADNKLYLKHVGIDEKRSEYLRFTFAFQTDSLEKGTLLLPYHVEENGFICNVEVNRGEAWDNQNTYEDAAYFEPVTNVEGFCVLVKKAICEAAGHHIAVMLNDMNHLSYEVREEKSPVTISAENVTPTGATILFHQDQSMIQGELICSHEFFIQQEVNGQWVDLPKAAGAEFPPQTYDIATLHHHGVDWEWMYGKLVAGHYRLGKVIPITTTSGVEPLYTTVYAEFTIDNVYAWFDFDADDPADRRLKAATVDLFGMEGTALSCDAPYNEIHLVNAEGMTSVISTDLMIRSAYLTDLTGDGIVEVCASVQKDAGMVIQAYDPSEEKLYELAGDDGSYFLTKKADRLCVLRKDIYWVTLDYGILGFSNDLLGGKKLEIQEIDSSLEALTKRISSVEVLNRRVVRLSRLQEIEKMMGFLESLKQQVKPAPGDVLQKAQEDTFNSILITIHYELGEKSVYFSEDYHLVWVYGSKEGFEIADPEPLKSYVNSLTNGVLRQETYGQAFATVDAPWDWCKYVTSASIESAKEHVCLYTYRNGNSFGSSSTNGVLSYDTLQQLLSILNQIPKGAFVKDKIVEKQSYHSLFVDQQSENTSVALVDGVNDLAVIFNYRDGKTTILLTDEMEKVSQIDGAYLEPTQLWSIQDQNLTAFMQEIFADPPVITYTIGAEYEWQDLMEFSADEFSLSLYLIEGWEHEYVQNRTSSGIRCRPEGITEGWIYFSFWSEGHVVKEENRFYLDGSWHGFPSKQSYPSSVSTPEGFNTSDAIWSYKAVYTDIGDYVIINDGADSWFMEYKDQIEDTISLSSFTVE